MAAYRRVYDSRHLQADCQEPGSAPNPTLGSRVWASFYPRFSEFGGDGSRGVFARMVVGRMYHSSFVG